MPRRRAPRAEGEPMTENYKETDLGLVERNCNKKYLTMNALLSIINYILKLFK